ncbi:MAG: methyl-accepting chemotaxis protein [Pseudomonadales bacterium]
MKVNLPVSGREVAVSDSQTIISMTDLKGAITYVNQDFIAISGFSEDELLGVNHNIVRHPDMPAAAYKDLWQTVKAGEPWRGIVKNRCKNGDHYWVEAFVTPIYTAGEISGYQSVRSSATAAQIKAASTLYTKLNESKAQVLPKQRDWKLRISQQFHLLQLGWLALSCGFIYQLFSMGRSDIALSAALLVAGLYLSGCLWVRAHVIKPLRHLASLSKSLANGDLYVKVAVDKPGALGDVQLSLDMIRGRLRAVIGRIQEASTGMVGATDQLLQMGERTSERMNSQMGEIEQSAAAIEEMSATVAEVSANTDEAARAAQEARASTHSGTAVVDSVEHNIYSLSQEIEGVQREIDMLHSDSQAVGAILEVIRSVAEQTNLLALNAAIEAARAGEQGLGFAVVADEVRALAQRVQSSTDDIQQLIEQLQRRARGAVSLMQENRESATHSVKQTKSASQALALINDKVNSIYDLNTQIATAAAQQAAVAQEMNKRIVNIKGQAEQTTQASQENTAGCRDLTQSSRRLNAVTKDYKV